MKLRRNKRNDEVERIAKECRPKVVVAGASAYPRFIDFERMAAIATILAMEPEALLMDEPSIFYSCRITNRMWGISTPR